MGIFNALQNLVSGATDAVQGPIQDALGGIADVPVVQDVQDLAVGATEAATSVTEQGQTAVEDITRNLGI